MCMKRQFSLGVLAVAAALCLPQAATAAKGHWLHSSPTKAAQGYLGIDIRDVTPDEMKTLKLADDKGAEIIDVDHDGPACKAGLELHDVILQMNGQKIDNQEQLREMLRAIPPGRTVTLVISRNGQQQTISTQMANREEVEREAWQQRYRVPAPASFGGAVVSNGFLKSAPPSPSAPTAEPKGHRDFLGMSMILGSSFTGAKLEVMGPQLAEYFGVQGAGLLVRSVDSNSPADTAGMKAGDVVVRVNQVPVASGNDWTRTVRENRGKAMPVVVLRDKREHTLTLTPDSKKRSSLRPGSGLEQYLNGVTRLVAEL